MVGEFVKSKAGHDKDGLFIVIAEDENYVYLSDGRHRKPEQPKKKRRKHVEFLGQYVQGDFLEKIKNGETVRPEEIKYAMRKYKQVNNVS